MIRIKKNKDKIIFRLTIWFHLNWFNWLIINHEFDSDEFPKSQVKLIEQEIIKELKLKFR